jgi:addiction module HigA family antidote
MRKDKKQIDFVHPGEIIKSDVLEPLGMSVNRLALELRVPVTRISEIVHGRRSITADTALRLARYLGTSPQFWMNLQSDYDLWIAANTTGQEIGAQVQPRNPDNEAVA